MTGGQAEADARARARLEEQVDDHAPLEIGTLHPRLFADFARLLGLVEDQFDFRAAQLLQTEEVAASRRRREVAARQVEWS